MQLRWMIAAASCGVLLAPGPAQAVRRGGQSVLVVRSSPPGASVVVDGVAVGVTPRSIPGVAAGSHEIHLHLAGRRPATRRIRIRRGERKLVHATLAPAKRLSAGTREQRKQAIVATSRRLYEWTKAIQLSAAAPGIVSTQGSGSGSVDPTTGLFYRLTTGEDEDGHTTVTAECFLDAAQTQPAGTIVATLLPDALRVGFQFTGGPAAGLSGTLDVRISPGSGTTVAGSGLFSDGSAWTLEFSLTLSGSGFESAATVDVTSPDGATSHWELTGSADGSHWHITTSDGYTLDLYPHSDGSGRGSLQLTETGDELASFTWTPDGVVTIVYPDGTTEEVRIVD